MNGEECIKEFERETADNQDTEQDKSQSNFGKSIDRKTSKSHTSRKSKTNRQPKKSEEVNEQGTSQQDDSDQVQVSAGLFEKGYKAERILNAGLMGDKIVFYVKWSV